MKIDKPGLYPEITEAMYHSDPVVVPSLSSSIAKVLLADTPMHAQRKHPRLAPPDAGADKSARKMDIGSAAHKLLLGKGAAIVPIKASSYRSNAAKQARDDAIASGSIPLLAPDADAAGKIAAGISSKVRAIPGCENLFDPAHGRPEVVMVWQDAGGPWCRSMMDWLVSDTPLIVDIKTTAAGISDQALASRISEGYDLSAGFYVRGLTHLRPEFAGRIRFQWVFVEQSEPFEVRVIEADRTTLELGDRKAAHAIELWRRCTESGEWPGYRRTVQTIEYPSWAENRWIERELSEEDISSVSHRMSSAPMERTPKGLVYGA